MTLVVEPVTDQAWLKRFIAEQWGDAGVVSRGRLTTADDLSGALWARYGGDVLGCVSWRDEHTAREVVTINATTPRKGVGTVLLDTVVAQTKPPITRLWLVTTNDNINALRFYQRRNWRIAAVHVDAIATSRRLKPSIPEIGDYGIPIRDEIVMEYPLGTKARGAGEGGR